MNHSIKPGVVPPPPGLEKEEPELADEEDIPSDDDTATVSNEGTGDEPLRDVERE
jgi:hypothetical protein